MPAGYHLYKGTDRLSLPCVQPHVCYPHRGGESDGDHNSESLVLETPASSSIKVCQHAAWQKSDSGIKEVLFRAILAGSLQNPPLLVLGSHLNGCRYFLLCYLSCLPAQSPVKNMSFPDTLRLIKTSMAKIDR